MDKHWIKYSVRWSMPLIKKYKWKLILILALMLCSVGLSLIQVNFIQQSVDAVLIRDVGWLIQLVVLFLAVTVLRLIHIYIWTMLQ